MRDDDRNNGSQTDSGGETGSPEEQRGHDSEQPGSPRRNPEAAPDRWGSPGVGNPDSTAQESPSGHPQQRPPTGRPPSSRSPGGPQSRGPGSRRGGGRGGRSPRSRLRRQRVDGSVAPAVPTDGDPVQEAYEGSVDLYDIATWEVRSSVDRVAMSVTRLFRRGKTVLLVGAAVLLFLVQVAVAGVTIVREPFIGVLAVSSVLPAVAVAGYLWYGDPTRREPFVALAVTFLLSVLFAGFAGVVNSTVGPVFEALGAAGIVLFYFVVVGPVEEFVKWLAIRVYAYRNDTFRTIIDGVVYGAAAGVGFAAIENFIYIVSIYAEASETAGIAPTEAATSVAVQRFLVGPGHVVFSAWAGFYLGLAKFNPENRGPIILKGLLVAAFIHALYNTSVTVLPEFLPGLALLGYIVLYDGFWFLLLYGKIRRYRELYRARYQSDRTRGQGTTRVLRRR